MSGYTNFIFITVFALSINGIFGSNFIPKSSWHCGAQNYPDSVDFSYNFARDNCFHRMTDANNCCEEHDNCYIYHSQEFCDKKFCDCLNSMAEGDESCQDVSDFFCLAVGLFGSSAWQAANENATTTTTTTEVTVKVTTTTPTQPLEKIPSVGNATQPPHIGHLDIHLYCFEHGIDTCITKFQECSTIAHILGYPDPHCKRNFCGCASHELLPIHENPSENTILCRYHLGHFCSDHQKGRTLEDPKPINFHYWSIHIDYFGISLNLSTVIMVCSALILIIVSLVWLYRRKRSGNFPLSISESKNSEYSQSHNHLLPLPWVRTIVVSNSSQALLNP